MIIPVRCFSCGKPISHLWEKYKQRVESGEDSKVALDSLGVDKFCCRSVFVSNVDMVREIGQFER